MEIKRFFLDKRFFDGEKFDIVGDEFIHMTKVLRHKVGYKIVVCLGDGKDYNATVTDIGRDGAVARLDSVVENNSATECGFTLFQALPKGDKFDFIAQKAVELGVKNIVPFLSEHTNEKDVNRNRCMRIMQEASKQCKRAELASLDEVTDIDGLIEATASYDIMLMAYENEKERVIGDYAKEIESAERIAVIVGSEGGFSESEYLKLKDAGVKTFSLGKRILRCETASVVAVSLAMYLRGEMKI